MSDAIEQFISDYDLGDTNARASLFVVVAEMRAALAASQARVAELELRPSPEICAENRAEGDGGCGCCVICCDESRKRAEKAEAESAAKDAALNALRRRVEELEMAMAGR